jgi:hypothetical protein
MHRRSAIHSSARVVSNALILPLPQPKGRGQAWGGCGGASNKMHPAGFAGGRICLRKETPLLSCLPAGGAMMGTPATG